MRANLIEIFSSVQGEGPGVGESTLFVRFGGCDLRCNWCDSPHTWKPAAVCRIERERGSGDFREVDNPVGLETVLSAVSDLGGPAHRWISLTGGEPLLQPALAGFAEALRGTGARLHLETHGQAADALVPVLPHLTAIAMDWKLASDVETASGRPASSFGDAHRKFLGIAREVPELCVKIIVTTASGDDEIDEAVRAVAELAPDAVLVLQPVTPTGSVTERPRPDRLLALARRAEAQLRDVRVIPQTHPVYGVL